MYMAFLARSKGLIPWIFLGICVEIPGKAATDPVTALKQADAYADAGNLDAAGDLYAEAEQGFARAGDMRNMYYARFGRLRKDVQTGSYKANLERLEADLNAPAVKADPALRIRGLALKGQIDMNLNTSDARRDWEQVAQLATQIGDPKWANRASGELGLVAGVEGDYATALPALLKAISTAQALHDVGGEIYFKTFLGNGMVTVDHAEDALSAFQSAINAAKSNAVSGYPILPVIGKVRALVALKRRDDARALIAEALPYARQHEILGAQTELLVQSGLLALDSNDMAGAEAAFREAAMIAQKASLPRMIAAAYSGLIDVYEARRNWPAAEGAANAALEALQAAEEIYDLPEILAKRAEVEAQVGRLAEADQLYEQATEIVEGMLVNMPTSLTKRSLIGAMSRVYTGHFRLAIEQFHDTAKAFSIIEQARGRSVADSLRYGMRPGQEASPWEIKITSIQQQIRRNPSPARLKNLLADLEDAETNLAGAESERNRKMMREMALLNTKAVPLKGLQSTLRPDETVLEYVLDDPVSFCLEISAIAATVHRLDSRKQIEAAIDRYLAAVRQRKDASDSGRYLGAALIPTNGRTKISTLIIIPDGKIHLLPFAGLIGPDSKFLVESTNIFYAPSGNALHVLRSQQNGRPAPRPFLGVAYSAIETPKEKAEVATRGLFDADGAEFRPLAFAREEITAAAEAAGPGSVVLPGASATESAVKSARLSDFEVLHFAAHGIENKRIPERAGLVFYPGSRSEDGLWQPREIRRANLRADLVVLSACETAVGKIEGEEGVANLARTFLVAGAKSVVASTWRVNDRATATLMAQMYSYLGKGESVASALRHAQIDMLRNFGAATAPFYWDGFLVIGDGARTISFRSTSAYAPRAGERLR
jgi:CHAT domain-containing protein